MPFDDPEWLAEEQRCLLALERGDGRAFDRLFQTYAGPLYRLVLLPRLGEAAAAEDALAETFRKAFERLGAYHDRGKGLWPYLATIATNQAHDVCRERARRGRALASFASLLGPLEQAGPEPDGAPLRAALERVLAVINPRYRRALELRFLEERPREECARMLEVKLATFDVVLLRALRAFKQSWQELIGERPEPSP